MGPGKPSRAWAPRLLLLGAVLFLAGYSLYGIAAPLSWGHHGFHVGQYTVNARATERFGTLTPSNMAGFRGPPSAYWYMHRPPGMHFVMLATRRLLGGSEWAARVAAALMSVALALAVARLARRGVGPWAGAGAAWVAVLLPYLGWFSCHLDEGTGGLFGMLMALGSYVAFRQSGRWRDGLGAVGWLALGGFFEWTPYMMAPILCLHALGAGLLQRRRDRTAGRRAIEFAFFLGFVLAVEVGLFFLWAWRVGALRDFVDSFRARGIYEPKPGEYRAVLVSYAEGMFTRQGAVAVGAWLLVLGGRLAARRGRARDVAPIALLFLLCVLCTAMKQYVHTHIYLIKAGLAVVVLCVVGLAADLGAAASTIIGLLRGERTRRSEARAEDATVAAPMAPGRPGAALAALLLAGFCASLARPWWFAIRESRAKGGIPLWPIRYDPDLERMEFARLVHAETSPGDLLVEKSFTRRYEWVYYADRDEQRVNDMAAAEAKARGDGRALIVFQEPLPAEEDKQLRRLLARHGALVAGPFWMVDLRTERPGIRAFNIVASRKLFPAWERFLRHPAFAPREVERNPWREVDLSVTYRVRAAPGARSTLPLPTTVGRHRQALWHDYQILIGETARAAEAKRLIVAGFDSAFGPIDLTASTRLGGLRFVRARSALQILWEARTRGTGVEETLLLTATPVDASGHALDDGKPALERVIRIPLGWAEPGFVMDDEQLLRLPDGRYRVDLAPRTEKPKVGKNAKGKDAEPAGPARTIVTVDIRPPVPMPARGQAATAPPTPKPAATPAVAPRRRLK